LRSDTTELVPSFNPLPRETSGGKLGQNIIFYPASGDVMFECIPIRAKGYARRVNDAVNSLIVENGHLAASRERIGKGRAAAGDAIRRSGATLAAQFNIPRAVARGKPQARFSPGSCNRRSCSGATPTNAQTDSMNTRSCRSSSPSPSHRSAAANTTARACTASPVTV
jgi:hypothetical protein